MNVYDRLTLAEQAVEEALAEVDAERLVELPCPQSAVLVPVPEFTCARAAGLGRRSPLGSSERLASATYGVAETKYLDQGDTPPPPRAIHREA